MLSAPLEFSQGIYPLVAELPCFVLALLPTEQGVGFILRLIGTIQDKWLVVLIYCVVLFVGWCPHPDVHKDIHFCHLAGLRSAALLPSNN